MLEWVLFLKNFEMKNFKKMNNFFLFKLLFISVLTYVYEYLDLWFNDTLFVLLLRLFQL